MFESRSTRYYLSMIIIFSVIVKLVVFALLYHLGSKFSLPDTGGYTGPAIKLLNDHVFLSNHSLWERTPLYPLVITAIFGLFGQQLPMVVLAQIGLSVLLIINIYRITMLLSNDRRIGLLAAAVMSIDYLVITYANFVMTDLIYAIFMSFVFYHAICFIKVKATLSLTFKIGVFLALATLTRPVSYYLTPLLAILLFVYQSRKVSWRRAAQFTVLLILPSLVLVGAWQVRNKLVVGSFQYTNIEAMSIYYYYAADIIAHKQHISLQAARDQLLNRPELRKINGIRKYDYYQNEGVHIIKRNPRLAIIQGLKGFVSTLFGNDYMLLFYNRAQFIQGKKVESLLYHLELNKIEFSGWLKLFVVGLFFTFNFILVLFALYYICTELRSLSANKSSIIVLLIIVGYFLLVSSNIVSQARFRMPFEVLLDCFAALGACRVLLLYKQRSSENLIIKPIEA